MVTMNDIARKVGVSRAAVSRVLNPRQTTRASIRVSEDTRRRVLAAAEEMRYRPNTSAIAVRTGRFGCAALLLSTVANQSTLPRGLLDGIHDALAERNLHLVLARVPDERLTDDAAVPKFLREWMADGLIINYTHNFPAQLRELIRRHRLPFVWTNAKLDADCVHPDDLGAAQAATERLLRLGHRRIAYVSYTESAHYSAIDREAGCAQAMRAAGLTLRAIRKVPLATSERIACSAQWLAGPDRPTAAVTYGVKEALPIAAAARSLGLRTPRDLSLVTFDTEPAEDPATGLVFTTCVLPEYGMGQAAVEMLLEKIEDPARALPPRSLPLTLSGGTSAPPSGP